MAVKKVERSFRTEPEEETEELGTGRMPRKTGHESDEIHTSRKTPDDLVQEKRTAAVQDGRRNFQTPGAASDQKETFSGKFTETERENLRAIETRSFAKKKAGRTSAATADEPEEEPQSNGKATVDRAGTKTGREKNTETAAKKDAEAEQDLVAQRFRAAQERQKRAALLKKGKQAPEAEETYRVKNRRAADSRYENQYSRAWETEENAGRFKYERYAGAGKETGDVPEAENPEETAYAYGYEYRGAGKKRRSFSGSPVEDSKGAGQEASGTGKGKKRNFQYTEEKSGESPGKSVKKNAAKASNDASSDDMRNLARKPFEAGKRTFAAEKQMFGKTVNTAQGLSSGNEDADQIIQAKGKQAVKTLMIKSATEAAKLPMRIVRGIVNLVTTAMAAVATGGMSLLLGILGIVLGVTVGVVCIVFTAVGLLYIGNRQGMFTPDLFPSMEDFLNLFNWIVSLFQSIGDIFS